MERRRRHRPSKKEDWWKEVVAGADVQGLAMVKGSRHGCVMGWEAGEAAARRLAEDHVHTLPSSLSLTPIRLWTPKGKRWEPTLSELLTHAGLMLSLTGRLTCVRVTESYLIITALQGGHRSPWSRRSIWGLRRNKNFIQSPATGEG